MNCTECGQELGPPASTGRPRRYCSRSCQSKTYRRRRDQGRLAAPPARTPPQKSAAPLLKAAVSLADVEGIGAVTLRNVAHHAQTRLAAVQRAFTSRDQLVIAMVQHVFPRRGRRQTKPEAPLDTLTRLAEEEWAVYRAHPWLVTVLASTRPPLAPVVLDIAQQYVDAFIALGTDPATALGRYLVLSGYVQGMALILVSEQQEATGSQKSHRAWWSDEIKRLNRTGSPLHSSWIAELSSGDVPDSADLERWFQDGLKRIVASLTDEDSRHS